MKMKTHSISFVPLLHIDKTMLHTYYEFDEKKQTHQNNIENLTQNLAIFSKERKEINTKKKNNTHNAKVYIS